MASREWGWFVLIQKTRGMIGLPNPEEELRVLEEKSNESYGAYKAALDVTAQLEGSMDGLKEEIQAMTKQLEEEQGNISVYTDRQAKAMATKAEAEAELAAQQAILAQEEGSRLDLAAQVKAHSGSVGVVKKEIEDIELAISKVELEKGNRDHTIKTLQDEIAEQDEVINKLNKEKKHIAETQAKSNDDSLSINEKVAHLTSVKSKLESTLDELENGLDKEKKNRAALEKQKRKVEGELKMAQDSVADLERSKRDLEGAIANKDKNNHQLAAKLHTNRAWWPRAKWELRSFRVVWRRWRKNWKPNVSLVLRQSVRDLIWRERLTNLVSVWMKLVEPLLLKLNSTRRERLRCRNSARMLKRQISSKSPFLPV